MADDLISHLDEDPVLTVVDAIANQTAYTARVNLYTSPLRTTHSNITDNVHNHHSPTKKNNNISADNSFLI